MISRNSGIFRRVSASLDRTFGVHEAGSSLRTELAAGLTTFFAMAYILLVNARMFSDPFGDGMNPLGVSYEAIYIATALSAVVGTLAIGLLANLPLAQASGMGLNAYFVYTCVLKAGLTYANALVLVLIEGLLFILLTLTGLRGRIFRAIPAAVRTAIPAGIGLLIAFLGLQNARLIIPDASTGVALASFNLLDRSWTEVAPMAVSLLTLLVIAALKARGRRSAVLLGMLGGTAAYYLLSLMAGNGLGEAGASAATGPATALKVFGEQSFLRVLREGFDFSAFLQAHSPAEAILIIAGSALAFCMVDLFDTLGTLYGACARGGLLNGDGEPPRMNRALMADAIATTAGALLGTSTVTTYVESAAGVEAGGRTGLAALTTAALFLAAAFLSPLARLIPACATAPVLIYVGVLMAASVRDIRWDDITQALPAFLTLVMIPFTCNISFGVCFGLLGHILLMLLTGRARQLHAGTWTIGLLFLALLLLTH